MDGYLVKKNEPGTEMETEKDSSGRQKDSSFKPTSPRNELLLLPEEMESTLDDRGETATGDPHSIQRPEIGTCTQKEEEQQQQKRIHWVWFLATAKWKILIASLVSVLVLLATFAACFQTDRMPLNLLRSSPGGETGPIPLNASPLPENIHAAHSGGWGHHHNNHNSNEEATRLQEQKLGFLIEILSPVVSQISDGEGCHLTDYIASRRNDESIVFKGSPQHHALAWLSHAMVCHNNNDNNNNSNSSNDSNSNSNSSNSHHTTTAVCTSLLSRSQLLHRYSLATMHFAWNGKSWHDARGWLSYYDSKPNDETSTSSSTGWKSRNSNDDDNNDDNDDDDQKYPSDVCLWKGVTCRRHRIGTTIGNGLIGATHPIPGHPSTHHHETDALHEGKHIVGLNLSGTNLVGTMGVVQELGLLEHLEHLDLSDNRLEGTIPNDLGILRELTSLDLSQNLLSGSLPGSISNNLSNLQVLHLHGNYLVGGLTTTTTTNDHRFGPPCRVWKEFSADCLGAKPKVECPCCTNCCGSTTLPSLRGTQNEEKKQMAKSESETIACQAQVPED